jgi:C-terminal processing protease CtpA/Prc
MNRETFMDRGLVRVGSIATLIVLIGLTTSNSWGQQFSAFDRSRAQDMFREISSDVKKHYYDPTFHGISWDARIGETKEKIAAADSMNRALSVMAAALDALNDSHTFLLPPSHVDRYDYGWQAQVIGERCFVIRVRPGSDAEKKGVKPGDELEALNGYNPSRDNLWRMQYTFNMLRPQPFLRLDLRDPTGKQRQVDAITTTLERKRLTNLTGAGANDIWDIIRESEDAAKLERAQFVEFGNDLGILRFPGFFFSESEIDSMIGKVRKHKALILDLRENPGGSVDTLKYLIGGCFEKEIKVGDRVGRSDRKPMVAKSHGNPFTGKLIVLVDSKSASAAELFARVIQIEKRGVVFGDRSSGSVMEAKRYSYHAGLDIMIFYGASITDADIIMADGKSLEHNGVLPDEVILPSAEDLANGRDPILAHAAETVGVRLSPEAAGKLFPYQWPKSGGL